MSDVEDAFVRGLLEAFPVFRADLDRALEFYEEHKSDGYVRRPTSSRFLLTLTSNVLDRYLNGGPAETEQFRGLLSYLEAQLGRDPEVDELIESRVVELLPEPGGPDARVLELLGPKMRAARLRLYREAREAVPESTVRFLDRMVEAVPPLRERLREHLAKYQWALPHTFMDDVTAEAIRLHKAGQSDAIRPLLEFLEAEFGVDEFVDNLIALSFVEALPKPGEPGADMENLLGPKLRGELERQRNWSQPPPGGAG
jgi:hypothetical protein